jgi:hypothetical protein
MTVSIAPQFTQRASSWTIWKAAQALKGLVTQYEDDGTVYNIWGYDGPEVHICTIWKGTLPDSIVTGGYSQGQNDSDKTDFETYYKPLANKPIGTPVPTVIDGYVSTSGSSSTRVMATTYTEQSSNAQRSLVSSSANDAAAGTGARSVRLTYYDQALAGPFTEDVTMNGTTPVNTVASNICFIERIEVLTVGANGSNAGTISLKATTAGGGATVGSISTDDNETNWCHHYIGAGRNMKLESIWATVKGVYSGVITVRRSKPTVANSPEITITPALRVQPGSQERHSMVVPVEVQGPARISVFARSDSASGTLDWNVGFGIYEA